jgi:hypothetical protein
MVYHIPRCEVVPLECLAASFRVDGREVTRWNWDPVHRRPFFYPLRGPVSGESLTRIGHPGAPNHDHHRSIWFAHAKVLGIDFWSENTPAVIRQERWLVYEDGDEAARMAVQLGWYDGHDPAPLIEQELVAVLTPLPENEYTLELHSTFVPRSGSVELQQTNFGCLAVRVTKSLSAHFGGGELTGSDGRTGEPALFALPNRWMDYSGPMPFLLPDLSRGRTFEGITYIDHPHNPGFPAKWHVRADGWMGAALCLDTGRSITRETPLVLRYLLHVHRGPVDRVKAEAVADQWQSTPGYRVVRSTQPHRQFAIERTS